MGTTQPESNEPQNVTEPSGGTTAAPPKDFKECCFEARAHIESLKTKVKHMKEFQFVPPPENAPDDSERKANLQLAYRHLEDARMRIGKAIQAYDGGTSCYPR